MTRLPRRLDRLEDRTTATTGCNYCRDWEPMFTTWEAVEAGEEPREPTAHPPACPICDWQAHHTHILWERTNAAG